MKINKCGCPKCNGDYDVEINKTPDGWEANCLICGSTIGYYNSSDDAITAWNTAHPDYEQQIAELTKEIARLASALNTAEKANNDFAQLNTELTQRAETAEKALALACTILADVTDCPESHLIDECVCPFPQCLDEDNANHCWARYLITKTKESK